MSERQDELLRDAARSWLDAVDGLEQALGDPNAGSAVMDAADAATIARLRFHQTLVELGWTPPTHVSNSAD